VPRLLIAKSADGARRTAEQLSLSHTGVVAYSIISNSETEDYDDQPTIFYRAGELPIEFDSMPISFRLLYGLLILHHDRRQIL
jgi:hypothetical protein